MLCDKCEENRADEFPSFRQPDKIPKRPMSSKRSTADNRGGVSEFPSAGHEPEADLPPAALRLREAAKPSLSPAVAWTPLSLRGSGLLIRVA